MLLRYLNIAHTTIVLPVILIKLGKTMSAGFVPKRIAWNT